MTSALAVEPPCAVLPPGPLAAARALLGEDFERFRAELERALAAQSEYLSALHYFRDYYGLS